MKKMKIIKASGEETSYDQEKIVQSLKRTGASDEIIKEVLSKTEKELFEGIHTKALYKIVFENLKKLSHGAAGKYHLKNAIMELGPTGFPFEKFIAGLLEVEGFAAVTNQIVQGRCVKHEIDIIADKGDQHFMMECKFHGYGGSICDIKTTLYVYARFLDVENNSQKFHQAWLVTNTRLSKDAEVYGNCVGMGLLSWNYPKGHSLRERIDRSGLYPITCLSSLSEQEKQTLLNKNIVLCQTLCERPAELNELKFPSEKNNAVLEEAKLICKNLHQE